MPTSPLDNHLLGALPPEDLQRLSPHLGARALPLGAVGVRIGRHAGLRVFPDQRIVSLLYVLEDGASAEIAVIGNEGMVGISLFMGGETTPSRAVVQSAGHGYRLRGADAERRIRARRRAAAICCCATRRR